MDIKSLETFDSVDRVVEIEDNDDRNNFYPKHYRQALMQAESSLFSITDRMMDEYSGGFWDYYEIHLTTGDILPLAVPRNLPIEVTIGNPEGWGDKNRMPSEVAMLAVTVFWLSWLGASVYDKNPESPLLDKIAQNHSCAMTIAYDLAEKAECTGTLYSLLD